ncbi:MAG: VUT family protein, partial [Candidatus Diapherotrites archaeon]|nr:VUT family protein [Candidatus Diapherotrites archaeon]
MRTETRFFAIITGLFVAVLLISNAASTKIVDLGIFVFDGGTLLFPLSYIFGDILTEV